MKKFLIRIGAFIGIAICGFIVLLAAVIILNHRAIVNCRVEPHVNSVVIGDSHPAWAIDDSKIPGLRNISQNAEGYKYTYAKMRHLLDKNPDIERVYLGFSYHNLSSYFDEYVTGEKFRLFASRYLSVLAPSDILEVIRRDPLHAVDFVTRLLREGFVPGLRGECRLYGRFSSEPMLGEFRISAMEHRIAEQYFDQAGALRGVSRQNLDYLVKIIELARSHGVELIVMKTPLHEEYLRRVPRKFRDLYEAFIEEHGLSRYDFPDLDLGDEDFLPDGDHTNYRGAMRATSHFAAYHLGTRPVGGGS